LTSLNHLESLKGARRAPQSDPGRDPEERQWRSEAAESHPIAKRGKQKTNTHTQKQKQTKHVKKQANKPATKRTTQNNKQLQTNTHIIQTAMLDSKQVSNQANKQVNKQRANKQHIQTTTEQTNLSKHTYTKVSPVQYPKTVVFVVLLFACFDFPRRCV